MSSTATQQRPAPQLRHARERSPRLVDWSIGAVVLLGTSVLLYPAASQWITANQQQGDVIAYVNSSESIPSEERAAMLAAAAEYNDQLPRGPLRDPYSIDGEGKIVPVEELGEEYLQQLALADTDAMARVSVPSVGIDLAVYHGTDDDTLMRGAGHLFGSSLPVGGESTHSVITAHSGIPNARLFTDLENVELGDQFTVTVLGERLTYEVDQIEVVEPNDARELEVIPGADHVTLLSCTPTGVNSHRLLVRGVRVDVSTDGAYAIAGDAAGPRFPWWMLGVAAGVLGAAAVISVGPKRSPKHKTEEEQR